ncbi:Glutamyl-tRNA(Gln) amidotransferase subunit A, mitochondrial [Gryllus bimaculatus]|nr:Glutamyl-tRNA(Gln) amidotransferase subunit A, mitochondrial [Gryllus bimaculatus]
MADTFARRLERLAFRFVEFVFGALFRLLYRGPGEQVPPISNLLLLDSATTLAHKIRTKKVTSVEVVEAFIARIREVNLVLNTVVDERFEEALKEAKAADEYIRSGAHTPEELERNLPFLGVPFTTKDCVQVKGLRHTAGLYKRRNLVATEDADCVAQMRAAGAFPLAVTNVSELCMWWESNNTIYGRTRNPYNTNRIVGGSSGGEGCLQSCSRLHQCGVVSNAGQYPIPNGEQNTFLGTGPMTRFATDLLPIFKVLAGPVSSERLGLKGPPPDLRKVKVFYAEDDGGGRLISAVQPDQRAAIKRAVNHLEKALGIKAKKIYLPRLKKALPIWFAKMQIKDAPTFAQQLDNCEGTVNIFLELVKWALFMSKHTFIGLFTAIMEKNGVQAGSETHTLLLNECVRLRQDFQDILGDDGVFLFPTHPTVAPFHNEPALKPYNFSYTAIFNVLGFPATQCPLGLGSEGLPLGLQVIANLNQDRLTLAMACELEKAFGGWVPPAIAV